MGKSQGTPLLPSVAYGVWALWLNLQETEHSKAWDEWQSRIWGWAAPLWLVSCGCFTSVKMPRTVLRGIFIEHHRLHHAKGDYSHDGCHFFFIYSRATEDLFKRGGLGWLLPSKCLWVWKWMNPRLKMRETFMVKYLKKSWILLNLRWRFPVLVLGNLCKVLIG